MPRILLILLSLLTLQCQQKPSPEPDLWGKAKRILFLGNSITYAGAYVDFVEAYWTLSHPEMQAECINLGLSSETVSGLSEPEHAQGRFPRPDLRERLARALASIKPDLIFACYGMNDGIYLPFDEERFAKFKNGIHYLHQQAVESGAEIIHLTPPIFDHRHDPAYANVLDLYSDWLISQRYTADWKVIDVHWPMQRSLDNERARDSSFYYARDGIHPNSRGHWLMAKEVLTYLGAAEVEQYDRAEAAFASFPRGEEVLQLIQKRQAMLKHAYLSSVGHQRPGVKEGLPLPEAQIQADSLTQAVQALLTPH
ncbi:MAG: SGNH/GDSL hydrolase family protein [Bacteroidota bacterium]